MDQALLAAAETDAQEAYIIGGGEIFRQSFSIANKIYLTRVHTVVEGDVFFPGINESEWQLISNMDFSEDEKHKYPYSFQVWKKRI